MYKFISVLILVLLILSCKQDKPIVIKPSEHRCEYCRMQIIDMRFDSQAITHKGRRYHFDSIECLVAWLIKNEDHASKFWIKNYIDKNEWIELSNAYILQSQNIPSPMGGFFSAYKTEKEREEYKNKFGGKAISLEEIRIYLKTSWKSDMMK